MNSVQIPIHSIERVLSFQGRGENPGAKTRRILKEHCKDILENPHGDT